MAADHRGFDLKEKLKKELEMVEIEVSDLGAFAYNQDDDYTDVAFKFGEKVVAENGLGVIICGSGGGVTAAVNKVLGVRGVMCSNTKQAYLGRNDDDANVLCLSADTVDESTNIEIVKTFINSIFSSEERHIRRIKEIAAYETEKCN